MEKVVYFLGAGFSAPLGIPIMKDFFEKSKDIYFSDKERYKHFQEVINTFNEFNLIKSFYNSNLFNIEELLSILEMRKKFHRSKLKKMFLQYIKDVIEYYTPELKFELFDSADLNIYFNRTQQWNNYLRFLSSILQLEYSFEIIDHPDYGRIRFPQIERLTDSGFKYNIISLNYDLVLEKSLNFLNNFAIHKKLKISRLRERINNSDLYLAKLHGSIDDNSIVPPTWNKTLRKDINEYWELASDLLKEANHIRFIGYSLPDSDAYVRYLLKSSITKQQHLKSIDVICYDPDGSVRERYNKFIVFPNYKFISTKTEDYLNSIPFYPGAKDANGLRYPVTTFTKLETIHNNFIVEQLKNIRFK